MLVWMWTCVCAWIVHPLFPPPLPPYPTPPGNAEARCRASTSLSLAYDQLCLPDKALAELTLVHSISEQAGDMHLQAQACRYGVGCRVYSAWWLMYGIWRMIIIIFFFFVCFPF
ncbi:hypothetical protein EON63_17140 [archaeon]|nr:MAG: hypothetical protein EON63_17140 [archaeon]